MATNFFTFLFKTTLDLTGYAFIALTVLGLLPDSLFPNYPFQPKKFDVTVVDKVEKWNNLLDTKTEYLVKDQVYGPESLAINADSIYTGLADGRLIEINKKTHKLTEIARFQNQPVCDETKPAECGRILGLKFGKDGHLYAVDYFKGVFKINLKTNEKTLFAVGDVAQGYDDLEFDPQLNVLYVSVFTTKWTMSQAINTIFEPDNSGYLIAYNVDTKKSHKIRTGIFGPNGVQLSHDKKHLYVTEMAYFRVLKISIQNLHKAMKENRELADNEIEVFATLPGEPDNIRLAPNGDILAALFSTRKNGKMLHDYLANWPVARKAIARAFYGFGVGVDYINEKLLNSPALQTFASQFYSNEFLANRITKSSSIVRIDAKSGQISQIFGSESFNGLTEADIDSEGDLYFGSFISRFVGRIRKQNIN